MTSLRKNIVYKTIFDVLKEHNDRNKLKILKKFLLANTKDRDAEFRSIVEGYLRHFHVRTPMEDNIIVDQYIRQVPQFFKEEPTYLDFITQIRDIRRHIKVRTMVNVIEYKPGPPKSFNIVSRLYKHMQSNIDHGLSAIGGGLMDEDNRVARISSIKYSQYVYYFLAIGTKKISNIKSSEWEEDEVTQFKREIFSSKGKNMDYYIIKTQPFEKKSDAPLDIDLQDPMYKFLT